MFQTVCISIALKLILTTVTISGENNWQSDLIESIEPSRNILPDSLIQESAPIRLKRQIYPTPTTSVWVMPTLGRSGSRTHGSTHSRRRILTQAEFEPGIHHEGNAAGITPQQSENVIGNRDDSTTLMQRINDHMTTIVSMQERILQRLENVEYRITKVEVQLQEKSEFLRTQIHEVGRKVEAVDWDVSKVETTVDTLRQDVSALRQEQTETRRIILEQRKPKEDTDNTFLYDNTECISKLQHMMATLYSLRGVTSTIQSDVGILVTNMTLLLNSTRALESSSKQSVTKQHLRTVLLDHFEKSQEPTQVYKQLLPFFSAHTSGCSDPTERHFPEDCNGVQQLGNTESGIYIIQPFEASQPFFVYCVLDPKDGAWLLFHNRFEGTVNFYNDWQDYKHGFGNLGGEFWLGLEKLHILTNQKVNELKIELDDFNLLNTSAKYSAFSIGSEKESYRLKLLGSYEGDAGDSLVYHAGMKFSTRDSDNDNWGDGNCAESHTGAWWFNGCDTSNLNGQYLNGVLPAAYEYKGMYWYDWHGPDYSLQKARMMIRPKAIQSLPLGNEKTEKRQKEKVGKKKERNKLLNIKHNTTTNAYDDIQASNVHDYIDDLEENNF